MILINDVEIKTVLDGVTWSGAKDTGVRTFNFSFLYNPLKDDIPKYQAKVNDKVEFIDENKSRFLGYIETLSYNTEDDNISVTCSDLMSRLMRSKCVGRFKGTLKQIADNICGSFGIQNGIVSDETKSHNIVSTGDLTYFDVLATACKTLYDSFTLYMDGPSLKLSLPLKDDEKPVAEFQIYKNIRSSNFSQSMSEVVTKVIMIDNNGKIVDTVQNDEGLQQFGLFQETYNYNTDIKNNMEEAKKLLTGVKNEAQITVNNNSDCISGKYIEINEPVNKITGIFEITSDNHTFTTGDNSMTLEVQNVSGG